MEVHARKELSENLDYTVKFEGALEIYIKENILDIPRIRLHFRIPEIILARLKQASTKIKQNAEFQTEFEHKLGKSAEEHFTLQGKFRESGNYNHDSYQFILTRENTLQYVETIYLSKSELITILDTTTILILWTILLDLEIHPIEKLELKYRTNHKMADNHRQTLIKFTNDILETVESKTLLPKLFATGVFAPKQIHKLKLTQNETDKLQLTLNFMLNRNTTAYHTFLSILEQSEYAQLANQIKKVKPINK